MSQSPSEYVMSHDRFQSALNDYSDALAAMLLACFSQEMDAGLDQFVKWAETVEQDIPEHRWAALQACATFTRGMLTDAGHDPRIVAVTIAAEQETPIVGVIDALRILGAPGNPEAELDDEWLPYATGTLPADQYVDALTFLFVLSVTVAPGAAVRLNQ